MSAWGSRFQQLWKSRPLGCFAGASACWILLLYSRALTTPFVYDDITIVEKNPVIASLSGAMRYFSVSASFSPDLLSASGSYYRPLTWLSFAVDRKLWGLDPTGFHVTNLVLSWLNSILGFSLLRRCGVSPGIAALTPLVWLALPINSEGVIWISARCYSLSVLFVLAALLLAQSYLARSRAGILATYFVACCAALLSHETGLLVVPLTVLIAYARGNFLTVRLQLLYLSLAGFSADAIYFFLSRITGTTSSHTTLSLFSLGATFFKYGLWMVFPLGMSIERSTDTPVNQLTTTAVMAWMALAIFCGAIILLRNKLPEVSAGLTWTFVALLPFCAIAIYQGMAERYEYLASFGLALAVVALVLRLKTRARFAGWCVLAIWLCWGVWRVEARLSDWSSEGRLYASSLETTPRSWVLLLNLGNTYLQSGNYQEATSTYGRALAIDPRAVKAAINLAASLQLTGNIEGAERAYEYAISLAPKQGDIYTNLGSLVFTEGKIGYAEQLLRKAISLNSSDATAYFNLGVLYERSGRSDEAIKMFQRTLQLNPEYPDAQRGLEQAITKSRQNSR